MKQKDPHDPYAAHRKYPDMNIHNAVDLEVNKPRNKMLGLRITENDLEHLKILAKKKGCTVTQVAYLFLLHTLREISARQISDGRGHNKKKGAKI